MDDDCQGLNDTELIQKASNKFVMTYCYTHRYINNLGYLYKKHQKEIVLSMVQKFKTRYPDATKERIEIFTQKLYHDAMGKAIQFQIRLSEDEIENIPEDAYIINPNNNSSNNIPMQNVTKDLNQQNDHNNSFNNDQFRLNLDEPQNNHNTLNNDQSAMHLNQQQNNRFTNNNNLHKNHHGINNDFDDFQDGHILNKSDNIINDSDNVLTNADDDNDDDIKIISIADTSRESTPYVPTDPGDNNECNSNKPLQRKRKKKSISNKKSLSTMNRNNDKTIITINESPVYVIYFCFLFSVIQIMLIWNIYRKQNEN